MKEAIRLGKRVDGRTRLLKIVVEEFKDKRMLLTKSVKLRESDSEAWKNVFITPDQTYKQRQENKELKLKCWSTNADSFCAIRLTS